MAMTREEEERQRIARAHENVDKWQERFGGFSGGVRVSYSGGPTFERTIGDPVLAKKVTAGRPDADAPKGPEPLVINPVRMPSYVEFSPPRSRQPRHWLLTWLFNLISVEK